MKLLKADDPIFPAIGLDVGDRRIGVAISRSGLIVTPMPTIDSDQTKVRLDAVESYVTSEQATVCVVGLPLLEDGREGEQAEKSKAFARSLARRCPQLRFVFFDERHSSADAKTMAQGKGARGRIDQLAAAIILQEFLDAKNAEAKKREEQGTS